jgi:hypothetical protein
MRDGKAVSSFEFSVKSKARQVLAENSKLPFILDSPPELA